MQSRKPIFSDISDLMLDAFSAAQAAGEEAKNVFRAQLDRFAEDFDLVSRDEFETLKASFDTMRAELDALKKDNLETISSETDTNTGN